MTFSSGDDPQPTRNRNRKRKVIWYNPPWNANVKTNLGRKFINIINRCFPNEHPVHKIFNKHTLKLSYSCMPDIKSIISSHNKAVLSNFYQSQTQTNDKECNCRKKDQCPLDGKCLSQMSFTKPQSQHKHHQTHKNARGIIQHPFDTKARETKLNYVNTFGHSKTTTNLSPSSGESLSSANLITVLTTNAIYAYLRNM